MNRLAAFARALLFLAAAVPIAAATLALLIAGWIATALSSVTPLVVPVLIAFRGGVGALAAADAALARSLLGIDAHPRLTSGGAGYWRRGLAVLADPSFWRQQVYLALRMTVGFAVAIGELALLAAALGSIAFPIWYRWSNLHFWSWRVDTLPRSLVLVPIGLVGLVLAVGLAQLFATTFGRIAQGLLGSSADRPPAPLALASRRRALAGHAAVSTGIGLLLVLVWALTGGGYVWPEWALLPLALVLAGHGWVELVDERPELRRDRGFAIHAGISASLLAFFVAVWALTTRGYFWPVWPALAFALLLIIHRVAEYATRRGRLVQRVGVLEHTRAAAVGAQEAELRRIERDLHDGAQARLVALGMSLGLAEQRFASDPQSAQQLVTEARLGVGEALRELRDLARGIHPPVLSDRGLGAALETLVDRSALPVSVSVDLAARLPDSVETAAYFVAAEAIANASKHSGASRIEIEVHCAQKRLTVTVFDDGTGGADATGSGLTGLRHRVEALDGTLVVTSPAGGPTTIRAELPCES
jgi:signal transduction histidine kinase